MTIKKVLLGLAVTALVFSSAQAQEDGIRFGAKAGANLANVNTKIDIEGFDDPDSDMLTSFHIGAVVEIPITEAFAFQPELLYSIQGSRTEVEVFTVKTTTVKKLAYLNIPLMAKYYIADGLSLEVGPQIGFNISAKGKVEIGDQEAKADIENVSPLDLGLNFGAGYQLAMGLFFQARYNLGLSNTNDDADTKDDTVSKNRVIQLSVGYKF